MRCGCSQVDPACWNTPDCNICRRTNARRFFFVCFEPEHTKLADLGSVDDPAWFSTDHSTAVTERREEHYLVLSLGPPSRDPDSLGLGPGWNPPSCLFRDRKEDPILPHLFSSLGLSSQTLSNGTSLPQHGTSGRDEDGRRYLIASTHTSEKHTTG